MSGEAANSTTKSKTELSAMKCKGQPLIFVTENPIQDSTGVLDALTYFSKIC